MGKIEELLKDKYKLRIPPTVYYELLADVWEVEEQEPTTKNDLGVDREEAIETLKENLCAMCAYGSQNMESCDIRSCDNRDAIKALEQEPKTGHWIPTYGNVECSVCGSVKDSRDVGKATHYCDFCGAKMVEPQESEG